MTKTHVKKNWAAHGIRLSGSCRTSIVLLVSLGLSMTAASNLNGQQSQASPGSAAPGSSAAPDDLRNMALNEACPDSKSNRSREPVSGADGIEHAKKLVETMMTCAARLKIAFQDDPNPETANEKLEQLIQAAQARVNELMGRGGLIEAAKLFIERLRSQQRDIGRHLGEEGRGAAEEETAELIRDAEEGVGKLEAASKAFNEEVIFLELQRPKIAFKLSLEQSQQKVEAMRDLIALVDTATTRFNRIGSELSNQGSPR